MKRIAITVFLAVCVVFSASIGSAHFNLNQNVRIHHVVHANDGLDVYLRMPMSYLVAGLVGPEDQDGIPAPAPFTASTSRRSPPT